MKKPGGTSGKAKPGGGSGMPQGFRLPASGAPGDDDDDDDDYSDDSDDMGGVSVGDEDDEVEEVVPTAKSAAAKRPLNVKGTTAAKGGAKGQGANTRKKPPTAAEKEAAFQEKIRMEEDVSEQDVCFTTPLPVWTASHKHNMYVCPI